MWSAVATSLEENRALSRIITALAGQSKQVVVKAQQVCQRAGQAAQEVVGVKTSIVSLTAGVINSVTQIAEIHAKLFQLVSLVGRLQREVQANAGSGPLPAGRHDDNALMCDGLPIADYITHMRRELDASGARIKSESVTIGGVTLESYDDTLKWVTNHFHKDDWKYAMDMPALYSLVKTDGNNLKALLEEQSHSSKAGYASSKQARLSLLFQCKIPEVFGPGKANKTYHLFGGVATYRKWRSTGNK
jgi:hypothetical protein